MKPFVFRGQTGTWAFLYREFIEYGVGRDWLVIGIGGGIVCDVAGFVASTYMRGLDFGLVATTLLAQVDAALGGKNGLNFLGYKNMVGTFRQPAFVLCDYQLLATLPEEEIRCGLSEIIKTAVIADEGLFSYLEDHLEECLTLEGPALEEIVPRTCRIKLQIVGRDESELGLRRKINFGHTIGHAFKKLLATCRPGPYDEDLRKTLLLECIRCGMHMVDVEADAGEEFKADIIRAARRQGSSVIISHHDDVQTPERPELEAIIARSFAAGADFVKIACRANSGSDSARLIGLLDRPRFQGRLIVVGMGAFGLVTRILAPFLGSPFVYASLGDGDETALGQVGYRDLARIHRDLKGLLRK